MFVHAITLALTASAVLACFTDDRGNLKHYPPDKRQTVVPPPCDLDWAYEASYNWGSINPGKLSQTVRLVGKPRLTHSATIEDYDLCQTGMQQSPIPLSLTNGLALSHRPQFRYQGNWTGNFYNWGYGPAFAVHHKDGVWINNPSFQYDNHTLYLRQWHIHAPGDHTVGADRSKAELHLVHVDSGGHEKAVLAIRLDPGNKNSTFFNQLPSPYPAFNQKDVQIPMPLSLELALENVQFFNEFWTYQGSLTSPPCHEGIRWFMARQILFTGVEQMRMIFRASRYSARAEQEVWQHQINV